jgi:hypothetical protein
MSNQFTEAEAISAFASAECPHPETRLRRPVARSGIEGTPIYKAMAPELFDGSAPERGRRHAQQSHNSNS